MIVPYWGEFLVTPSPLELSLDACTHGCVYCFATLNDPRRRANVTSLMRLLAEFRDRETYTALLMQRGYPTVVSNRSDPFCPRNEDLAVTILRAMSELGLPVALQTKGGRRVKEAMGFLPPSVWYVSISMLDDGIRARVEPHAPPIDERIALVRALAESHHEVVVGINPCVPEWIEGREDELAGILAEAGASGAWIERVHLNPRQDKRLSPTARAALGEDLIARARKRRPPSQDLEAVMAMRAAARDAGLEVFSVGQPERSDFFAPWERCYQRGFPTAQGFVNWCHDHYGPGGGLVTFEDFATFFRPQLPGGKLGIDPYLGSVAHNLWWTHKIPPRMTFHDLLGILYQEPRSRNCPARLPCFAYAGATGEEGWTVYVDGGRMPYLMFEPGFAFDSLFTQVAVSDEEG